MKKLLLSLLLLLFNSFLFAQVSPTLAVGLEKLTMNKGTIDVEVLTEIIMSKQKELKQEALKRFMFKLFPEANFTTKYYVQNCLNILLNEKNPQVIEKEILELTTNYALSLGVAYSIMKSNTKELIDADSAYAKYKFHSPYYQNIIIKENEDKMKKSSERENLNKLIKKYDNLVSDNLTSLEGKTSIEENNFNTLVSNKKELDKFKKKLARLNLRKNIDETIIINSNNTLKIPFGIVLDVVSLSLSDIPELQKKGFFKNKIDYTSSDFYLNLELNEEGKKVKNSLNLLKLHVCKKIRPYVQNYDIINEFLKKNKGKTVSDIKTNLQNESVNFLIQMINEKKWYSSDLKIRNALDEITTLENSISLINYNTIASAPKKIEMNSDCEVCSKINAYRESIVYQNSLESFNKTVINQNSDIKNLTDELIKLSPLKSVDFPNKTISKLTLLENTSSDPIKTDINNSINKLNYKIDNLINISKKYRNKSIIEILNDAIKLKDYIVYQFPDDKLSVINEIKINNLIDGNYLTVNTSEFNYNINQIEILKKSLFTSIDTKNDDRKKIEKDTKLTIKDKYLFITQSNDFYNEYLTSILDEVKIDNFNTMNLDTITISKASKILSNMHTKIKSLINNNDIQMSDIVYLDNYISEKMIELKIRDQDNDQIYNKIIDYNKIIIPLLKIRALQKINEIIDYDEELMNLFEFIANLNKLDKAETYQSIVNMLRDGSKKIEDNLANGEFKDSYVLFINAIKKYTLINPSEEYVEIDVVSFLSELQQYYDRNNKSRFSLYLSLGLNQNFFFTDFKFSDGEKINNISFASEKIGIKYRIANFNRFEGYENVVKEDVYLNKKAPFINQCYAIIYGAGLLYTLANTTTNQNFDFPHIGIGAGMRFYNALDLNLILGFPFVKDSKFGNNAFWGIGLDIPLGEYLEKIGSKK